MTTMLTAVTLDDARVRKISPAMPIKLRKHSANLLQQQQQQQHGELRREVLSPESLILALARVLSYLRILTSVQY